MDSANPYAPPRAHVTDVVDPRAPLMHADRGIRLVAFLLDQVISVVVALPVIIALVTDIATEQAFEDGGFSQTLLVGAAITGVASLVWCWLTILYVFRNGQTIGKKVLGIKVVRADGSRASLSRIFWLRNVVNTVLSIVPLYSIVDPLFIFSETYQCLHDKLADTIVVKA
jgi:uncharacterized RDD family membrane protein YckC